MTESARESPEQKRARLQSEKEAMFEKAKKVNPSSSTIDEDVIERLQRLLDKGTVDKDTSSQKS